MQRETSRLAFQGGVIHTNEIVMNLKKGCYILIVALLAAALLLKFVVDACNVDAVY